MAQFNMCDNCNTDRKTTLCTGDCSKNIWFVNGKCKLDEITYDTVYYVLQKNRSAKKDLLRITADPSLVRLAEYTNLVSDEIKDNMTPYKVINNPARTLPFYNLYGGNLNRNFKP